MRNVISTNAHVDVSDEYVEAVDSALDVAIPDRQTVIREDGQETFYVRLVQHDVGDGDRWAVDYSDPASREVEEFDVRADAEERYEEYVRTSAQNLSLDGDGDPIPFTETDVPGVPGYQG